MSRSGDPRGEARAELRRLLVERDGDRCFYCRRRFKRRPMRRKTFDHYIPYSLWRTWDPANLVLACERCNFSKDAALPWPLVWLLLANAPQQSAFASAA